MTRPTPYSIRLSCNKVCQPLALHSTSTTRNVIEDMHSEDSHAVGRGFRKVTSFWVAGLHFAPTAHLERSWTIKPATVPPSQDR